ncbi:sarcosine oxidase subunit alpha family protein [Planosporangium thailandense]|uniref:Sarcosine oxidase subunit alpha n=1 Tax=Planosporangium thailandense TaxID=765197 RepID=A0ABX0XZ31_9ACTN|nr:sarcosine oxidase subunit alpha family protein [Planosporangium thailandense]NJC71326.1 sarcosine oxidase subunit alpha family protein [Planosporangium thailandense]
MTVPSHRLPSGGRIDRGRGVRIVVDGQELLAHPGDTVASALLAHGRVEVGPSLYEQRPRGIVASGVEEPNALLQVLGPYTATMLPATAVPVHEGLSVATLSGLGRLDPEPDQARYDKVFVHTDVLVVGAGPAGLAAASAAARSGARVILVDDQSEPGGSLLSASHERVDGRPAADWVAEVAAELAAAEETTVLTRTSAFGSYDDNYVLAVEDRTDHLGDAPATAARQRLWHIRAGQVILATGAHERPLVFAGNDRPGVMLAGAVRTYLNRYAVRAGDRVVVATTNDSAYDLVADLVAAGVEVPAVVDARPDRSARAHAARVPVLAGSVVCGTSGDGRLTAVEVSAIDTHGLLTGDRATIACDTLAVSGGWSPVVHLHSQRQGRLVWSDEIAAFAPSGAVRNQFVVGAAAGEFTLDGALAAGTAAGVTAATRSGFPVEATAPRGEGGGLGRIRPVWLVPGTDGEPGEWREHFVDLQRDQTVADVWRAVGAGMRSVEHVKRYTSISTANDQGKTSAVNAIGVIAEALGAAPGAVGTTTFRAPYTSVAFAALAGRERGDLFDPERTTPVHPWHVAHGAEFEVVGQWQRPWYFPQPGETMDEAVARECRAARNGVAMMDASTLGKIEIVGADAGEFLDRIYTNGFKKLAVGSARYGVMCTADGMIFDDGVTLRLADDRYFMTTTTGGAARVLDWLEEWLQTEWPELDVYCTSVTEQWTTIAVVGPRSREVVGRVAPDLDVSNDAFPFMTFRETTLASGVPARICRISFSGELAYEINVAGWYGRAVWEQVYAAGQDLGITPYGTETMHVLRAEKGYVIVGQDTDGTVTPQDAGMGWAVSKLKYFVGKRSFDRVDTARGDRKHLVGLLPVDKRTRLPEGTQIIAEGVPVTPADGPVPMLGHVTSSYHSEALGRPFALGLVADGRNRIGQTVIAPVGDALVPVLVADPVLYDPEGSRRDG